MLSFVIVCLHSSNFSLVYFSLFVIFWSGFKDARISYKLNYICSMFPKSTHETFSQKLYQTFKTHKRFAKPKLSRTNFTICHYAGEVSWRYTLPKIWKQDISLYFSEQSRALFPLQVQYQSEQFLDKNKDYVVAEHQELLSASTCPFVSGLFPRLPEETSKSSKFSSIGARFKVYKIFPSNSSNLWWKRYEEIFLMFRLAKQLYISHAALCTFSLFCLYYSIRFMFSNK